MPSLTGLQSRINLLHGYYPGIPGGILVGYGIIGFRHKKNGNICEIEQDKDIIIVIECLYKAGCGLSFGAKNDDLSDLELLFKVT